MTLAQHALPVRCIEHLGALTEFQAPLAYVESAHAHEMPEYLSGLAAYLYRLRHRDGLVGAAIGQHHQPQLRGLVQILRQQAAQGRGDPRGLIMGENADIDPQCHPMTTRSGR